MASSVKVMEKPPNHQENLQPLRCPRCDSANTKFCYYNNYSLTQPRHFCKACKRYWTRGGTLRNVPVGGGCRKNKRVKRPPPSSSSDQTTALITPANHRIDISKASNNHLNSIFFGLPNHPSDTNLAIPNFHSRLVSNMESATTTLPMISSSLTSGYDFQSQFNTLGCFTSTAMTSGTIHDEDYRNGFNHTNQIRDLMNSNSLLSNFSLLGSSVASTTTSPTTASLLGASLHQQQKMNWDGLKENNLSTYDGLQMVGNSDPSMDMKGVKTEEGRNKVDWTAPFENSMEPVGSTDSSFYWNSTNNTGGTAWPDLSNYGSSVTPLI